MATDLRDTTCEASMTAVQSLLRTLDDAAEWEHRVASRVRRFTPPSPSASPLTAHLSVVADESAIYDELRARHEGRTV